MKKIVKAFICGILVIMTAGCEWELAEILHDDDSAPLVLIADDDMNNFVRLEIRDDPDDPIVITANDLEGDGKVVYRKSGQDVLRLSSSNFSIITGGEITITYLAKFGVIHNTYKDFTLCLERVSEEWFLSHNGVRFSELEIRSGRRGIESIQAR